MDLMAQNENDLWYFWLFKLTILHWFCIFLPTNQKTIMTRQFLPHVRKMKTIVSTENYNINKIIHLKSSKYRQFKRGWSVLWQIKIFNKMRSSQNKTNTFFQFTCILAQAKWPLELPQMNNMPFTWHALDTPPITNQSKSRSNRTCRKTPVWQDNFH